MCLCVLFRIFFLLKFTTSSNSTRVVRVYSSRQAQKVDHICVKECHNNNIHHHRSSAECRENSYTKSVCLCCRGSASVCAFCCTTTNGSVLEYVCVCVFVSIVLNRVTRSFISHIDANYDLPMSRCH